MGGRDPQLDAAGNHLEEEAVTPTPDRLCLLCLAQEDQYREAVADMLDRMERASPALVDGLVATIDTEADLRDLPPTSMVPLPVQAFITIALLARIGFIESADLLKRRKEENGEE